LKKNKISKNWINKQKRDIYVRQSKVDGYRSRAVYKLIEINQKFKILKNGISLIDLGSAPGSWSQYLSKNIKNGKILSIDIKKIDPIDNVFQVKGDFTQISNQELIKNHFNSKIDVVLSDMAENTTGNKNVDDISTGELCKKAMFFAKEILNKNGIFVSKIFMGSSFKEIISESKSIFKETRVYKPMSSKKDSKESFIICKFLR
jgi:23S rRNA (uridine2552-2'-O)-methyltransferase|tara:strand:+ start:1186 stop:1797 length:612 start_codon:yes stop_codon:yes gene_type:complete